MSNSNQTISVDLNGVNTRLILKILVVIGLVIVGFYFFNFNFYILKNQVWWKVFQNLSSDSGNWGTFGDYVGGILNPVIAAFAFYLISRTYELQKRELEATRNLLEVSTDAQKTQIELAALTAHLNSVLMRIDILKTERLSLLQGVPIEPKKDDGSSALPKINDRFAEHKKHLELIQTMAANLSLYSIERGTPEGQRFLEIEKEIKKLMDKSFELEKKIESFYREKI